MALLASVGSVQLLNCARGQATTISALQDFTKKPENLICLLQEPWYDRHGHPPILPGFDSFTPTPIKPKCVTYVRRISGLTATTTFTAHDSFLGTTITSVRNSTTITFTLFNFYSPGRAEPIARLIPSIPVPKECILMGDLNAHHVWWQVSRIWRDRLLSAAAGAALTLATLWLILVSAATATVILRA